MSEIEGSEVTFVGGKAIEQHEAADSNVEPDVKEDAMKAVREAIEAAGKESADNAERASKQDPFKPPGAKKSVERGEDGKFKPADGKPAPEKKEETEEETIDPDKASLKDLLRKREKIAKKESEFQKQIAAERQKVQEESRQTRELLQQYQHERRLFEQEKAKLQRIRSNPAELLRDQGMDPEQFIIDLAEEGTPQGQMRKQQQELQAQLKEIREWKDAQAKQAEDQKQSHQIEQIKAYRGHVEQQFLTKALDPEKSPLTSIFFGKHKGALIAFGDNVAAEFRELSNGREAEIEHLAEFIEEELAEGVKSWYEKNHGSQKVKETPAKTPPHKVKGSTLTADMSGERRALSKTLKDLDGDERLEAAKRAVGVALAGSQSDED